MVLLSTLFDSSLNESLSLLFRDFKTNPAISSYALFLLISSVYYLKENKKVFSSFRADFFNFSIASLLYPFKFLRSNNQRDFDLPNSHSKRRPNLIDLLFFKKLFHFIKICAQTKKMKNPVLLLSFALFLITRTFLSIKVATINATIVQTIINANFRDFLKTLLFLALFSVPATGVNAMIRFLSKKMSLSLRFSLVRYFTRLYLTDTNYYKISNVDFRIKNPDQLLTNVIKDWSQSLSTLFSDTTKPVLDILIFSYKLSQHLGYKSPLYVLIWYSACGALISFLSPSFAKLTTITHALEGDLRSLLQRIIGRSEEIAFYRGHRREKSLLDESFERVARHSSKVFESQLFMGVIDQFLTKYGSTLVGYSVLGLPLMSSEPKAKVEISQELAAKMTMRYIRNSSLLINFSGAIGRIVSSYKDLQRLAGHTFVLGELECVLEEIEKGSEKLNIINEKALEKQGWKFEAKGNKPIISGRNEIKMEEVPVVAPNGDIILKQPLSLKLSQGDDMIVIGPNGSGKSSAFRLLKGLWPLFGGKIRLPPKEIFFVAQKPYMTPGNLRDQLIYPDTVERFLSKGRNDQDLLNILKNVRLEHLAERHGLDTEKEWLDILSGGEKQRLAMARLYYHRPDFAVLDECTSAVSVDIEEELYKNCKRMGITIITISHKIKLKKFHKYMMKINDLSEWQIVNIGL